jgi:hypothetical protein
MGLGPMELLPEEKTGLKALDQALDQLGSATLKMKRQMLQAFCQCVATDQTVSVEEAELLRVFSDALGCPLPPILKP